MLYGLESLRRGETELNIVYVIELNMLGNILNMKTTYMDMRNKNSYVCKMAEDALNEEEPESTTRKQREQRTKTTTQEEGRNTRIKKKSAGSTFQRNIPEKQTRQTGQDNQRKRKTYT